MTRPESCSNQGRWGDDDELGTLNLIGPEQRVKAAGLVREGRVVSLAWDLPTGSRPTHPTVVEHHMLYEQHEATGALDLLAIAPHGFEVTHIDALAHIYRDGRVYNGRSVADVVRPDGLAYASVLPLARVGIFTRGILLDVAAARGLEMLAPGDTVHAADLDAAERLAGVRIGPGDAVLVRTGIGLQDDADRLSSRRRTGLGTDCLPWLFERDVAVYAGDCIEVLPASDPSLPMPLHQIGLASMGLVLVDAPALEGLTRVARELGRCEFLFVCAPLRAPRATGTAVNPLAIF